ncbi:MAG: hypothetical protein ACLTDS_01480 [Bianqueaceae bacterium]
MKMHAGEMNNGSDQRAHGGIFSVPSGETITPAGSLPIYVGAGRSFSRQPLSIW